jgi:hypothetical protein
MALIIVDQRIALVTKVYNDYAWQLKFLDNHDIVNVFYHQEEQWAYVLLSKINN